MFCFASLSHPVSVGGVKQDAMFRNVIELIWRHKYDVTCDVTSTIKWRFINWKTFVLKKLSVFSKFRVALLDPDSEQQQH